MLNRFRNRICFLAAIVCCVSNPVQSTSNADFSAEDFTTNAIFDLVNHRSGVIA